jgi:hypothetical protein
MDNGDGGFTLAGRSGAYFEHALRIRNSFPAGVA